MKFDSTLPSIDLALNGKQASAPLTHRTDNMIKPTFMVSVMFNCQRWSDVPLVRDSLLIQNHDANILLPTTNLGFMGHIDEWAKFC